MEIILGLFSIILPLAVFGGIIWLLVWSIKRAKRKFAEHKIEIEKQKEQEFKLQQEQENSPVSISSPVDLNITKNIGKETNPESFGKKALISILVIIIGPLRGITDPLCLAFSSMDTATAISKLCGFKTSKCRYCHHYFSSINYTCKASPTKEHLE
jgi:hypothetical protein